jgi:hypothetical protein
MAELLEHPQVTPQVTPLVPAVEVDELAARRSLREQIARLERELASTVAAAYPRAGIQFRVPSRGGPRLLDLGELEVLRDDLAQRLAVMRGDLEARAAQEAHYRQLIEYMLADPPSYKWVRVTNEHIGEPSCHSWHVRPRFGLIGMLMGWWRVKISSGCPLA